MTVARVERSAGLTAAVVLLAMSSGAVDALSFVGLGAVFASVMTGNLVLLGVAAVHAHLGPALAAATAIAAYVAGVFATAAWLRRHDRRRARRGDTAGREEPGRPGDGAPYERGGRPDGQARPGEPRPPAEPDGEPGHPPHGPGEVSVGAGADWAEWAGRLRRALLVVPVAQAVVLAGWLATDGRPGDTARLLLLAPSAFAMGVQSAGVNTLPLTGAATTYLTGTLTSLTTELATSGVPATTRRRFAVLAAALAGAALSAALLEWARRAAPVLPLAVTVSVLLVLTLGHARAAGWRPGVPRPGRSRRRRGGRSRPA